jgi:hypothetical protein
MSAMTPPFTLPIINRSGFYIKNLLSIFAEYRFDFTIGKLKVFIAVAQATYHLDPLVMCDVGFKKTNRLFQTRFDVTPQDREFHVNSEENGDSV